MTHSHKTHEEKQKCWANFGKCWDVQTDRLAQLSNKPHGTQADDESFDN